MKNKDLIIRILNSDIQAANETIIDFGQAVMGKDPLYHLSWGDKAFRAGAQLKVFTYAVNAMKENNFDINSLLEKIKEQILQRARHIPASSSACSNIADMHETAAWVELYKRLENE